MTKVTCLLSYFSSFYFLFFESIDNRELHSFPTRRSSDLEQPSHVAHRHGVVVLDSKCSGIVESAVADKEQHRRSEEHTSELQSRRDNVCRLLLEKKKSNASITDRIVSS